MRAIVRNVSASRTVRDCAAVQVLPAMYATPGPHETAVKIVDGCVEVVSKSQWRLLNDPEAARR
jgi:hypothetical protein